MTLTLNDTIELLKAILEECGVDCIVLIISSVVANGTILIPSFNTIKRTEFPFALSSFWCSFYENLDKIYQEIPCKSSFFPLSFCHSPSYFCLLKGWKVLSEPLFLASKGIFLLLSLQKHNPVFLVIFVWVMWFSVNNGIWLFRG